MELNELERLIQTRRSIRKWQDREVPDELLKKAIEIGTWAPNGGNFQGWEFVVVKDRGVIERIADAVWQRADLMASWPESNELGDAAERWRDAIDFIREAPAIICVLIGTYASIADLLMRSRGEDDQVAKEMIEARQLGNSRIQSGAAAIAYMLLALHQMGLGAVWMTGPLQAKSLIEEIIGVEEPMHLMALVPVGYPDEEKGPVERKPVDEVMRFIS
jgi:nitroreductase